MKYTVLLLVVFGIVAAISAVFLVNMMRVSMTDGRASGSVDVVTMKRSLPAMSVLTADAIEIGKAKAKEAPVGYLSSSIQAVGKILSVPVVQGQVLTTSNLIAQGEKEQLAVTAVPPGMRAVSVALATNSVSGGLLYPGCIVDVIATFKLGGGVRAEIKGEAISTTLLYGIQVLKVQDESVISKQETQPQDKYTAPSNLVSNNRLSVVLLVDPKQAEALQLAMDNGSVSLAMRNPLDQQEIRSEATVLNRGQLSKLGALLGSTVRTAKPAVLLGEDGAVVNGEAVAETVAYTAEAGQWQSGEPESWGVTIIRGSEIKEEEFKLDDQGQPVAQ